MMKTKQIENIEQALVKSTTFVATLCLAVTCLVMLAQVFLRRVFNSPIVWAEDLAVFLFIWITFLGAAILFQKRGLSSVDTLVMLFSEKIRLVIEAFVDLVILITSVYLMKLSLDFMVRQQALGHKLGGALGIPIWVVTLSIITSMVLMILFSALSIMKKILIAKDAKERK